MDSINLPALAEAKLPATYEAARSAIAECARIDECKSWSDKAAALASYARQAKDDSLRAMATRIQERAMRKAGELLKQIPPAHGSNQNIKAGDGLKVTRSTAAADAGLSVRQQKTALRLASIPPEVFDAQVERASPPTVTELAEQGKSARDPDPVRLSPWIEIECEDTREVCETVERFAAFCARHAQSRLGAINATEARALQRCTSTAGQWLERLAASLEGEI
jgi:hypothetical protein